MSDLSGLLTILVPLFMLLLWVYGVQWYFTVAGLILWFCGGLSIFWIWWLTIYGGDEVGSYKDQE